MNYAHTLSLSHRDRTAQERRRLKAAKLFKQGCSQAEAARQLQVSREAARQWYNIWKKKGASGLKSLGKPGPKPRLSVDKINLVEQSLLKGPTAYGFTTQIWTLKRIAAAIKQMTGVSYGTTRIWQILLALNWSSQKPETRAIERNEAAIQHWVKATWPRIKKKRQKQAQS